MPFSSFSFFHLLTNLHTLLSHSLNKQTNKQNASKLITTNTNACLTKITFISPKNQLTLMIIPKQNNWKTQNTQKGKVSWTPVENTYYHFLTFDLGEVRTINKIATLGRPHTNEFVTEYIIQYSDDGELWRTYVSPGGEVQVTHICSKSFDVQIETKKKHLQQ